MQAKRETFPELSFKELIALSGVAAFSENEIEKKDAQRLLAAYAAEKKKDAPGFFTPYILRAVTICDFVSTKSVLMFTRNNIGVRLFNEKNVGI